MENTWSAYLVLRLIIGFFDGLSDILIGFHLISDGHPYWGLAILAWIVVALFISFLYVLIGRCKHGDPMTIMKYIVLSLKVHAEIIAAYIQSGPSLIVQLVIVWSGVHQHDFEAFVSPATWGWFWAWLEVFSIVMSFVSLVFTSVRYNDEPGPIRRLFWSVASSIVNCMYRVFVISIMFKLSPVITCIFFVVFYLITTCIHRSWGDDSSCILHAYCCLFLPVGHTHSTCAKPGYSVASGIPEAERTRINQEGLFKRIQKFSILHLLYNLFLIVPYITFSELWLHPSPELYNITPILSSRLFTYLTAVFLLIMSLVLLVFYYFEARKAVHASTVWTKISTNSSQPHILENPSAPLPAQNDVAIPIPSSPSRPMSSHTQPQLPAEPASLYDHSVPQPQDQINKQPESLLYPHLPSAPKAPSEIGDSVPAGNRKCDNDNCVTCAWLVEGPAFFSMVTNKQYRFMTPVTCTDDLLIYLVTCRGCRKQYVGKTEQTLRQRHYGHRREIETQSSPLGQHFGSDCGYSCWSIQIIDKCSPGELARREGYWQHELRSLVPDGLNIRDELGGRLKI